MRIVILGILVFAAAFGAGRWMSVSSTNSCSFEPTPYPMEDRSFVVAVMGRNNGAYLEKVLSSVFSQRYPKYRMIYVDDASDDGSFELAKDLIGNRGVVLKNDTPLGKKAWMDLIRAQCQEQEIVVALEGEEWFAHEWVLARLNQYYAHPDLKIAAGAARVFPTFAEPFERGLVSCYAAMLQQGSLEELFDKNDTKHTAEIPETLIIRRGVE